MCEGMLVTEAILDHLSAALDCAAEELRAANLYSPDDETHFGQGLGGEGAWRVPRAWREMHAGAEVAARREEVAAFNSEHKWRKRGLAVLPTKYATSRDLPLSPLNPA